MLAAVRLAVASIRGLPPLCRRTTHRLLSPSLLSSRLCFSEQRTVVWSFSFPPPPSLFFVLYILWTSSHSTPASFLICFGGEESEETTVQGRQGYASALPSFSFLGVSGSSTESGGGREREGALARQRTRCKAIPFLCSSLHSDGKNQKEGPLETLSTESYTFTQTRKQTRARLYTSVLFRSCFPPPCTSPHRPNGGGRSAVLTRQSAPYQHPADRARDSAGG